jgi:integrase
MDIVSKTTPTSAAIQLTKSVIDGLPTPATGQALFWDVEVPGFGMRITATGKRSFIVQRRIKGVTRRVTLGSYGELTPKKARDNAREVVQEMRKGVDPVVEKKKKEALGVTLREVMVDYLANKKTRHGKLAKRSQEDIENHVTKSFAAWADKPVTQITRDACVKRFREMSKTAPGQANQAFRNLRALLNWARESNATNEGTYPILAINPVVLMFKTARANPEKARSTRIPNEKIGAVWSMLEKHRTADANTTSTVTSADLTATLLLTGMRITEAASLRWDSVNLEDKTLHLANTKNHNPITLPLSGPLFDLLTTRRAARAKGAAYVFPARIGESGYMHDPRAMMLKVSQIAGMHLSAHDMRRTFIAVALACNVEMFKAELLTNHVAQSVTLKHYTETSDLRYLAPEVQQIADWIVNAGAAASTVVNGTEMVEQIV